LAAACHRIHDPSVPRPRFAPLGVITEEHFDKTLNANVKGLLSSTAA
jgi:hypothetical protein